MSDPSTKPEVDDNDAEAEDELGELPAMAPPPRSRIGQKRRKSNVKAMSLVQFEKKRTNRDAVLEQFLEAIREISAKVDPQEVADTIISQTTKLLNCHRATVYYVDDDTDELILMVAKGVNNIRVPIGNGIAGHCAQSGETENIEDAYQDSRFSDRHDKSTGYKTNSILATPVVDTEGTIVAVLQCINKIDAGGGNKGRFTKDDVVLLENLALHVGVCLRNAHLFESTERAKNKIESLVDVVKALHRGASNTHSLIFTLTHRCTFLVDADRCTLYLVDRENEQLVVMQGDVDIRVPLSKGLAGWVAVNNKTLNIADAYEDDRFSQVVDKQSGYRTRTVLAMPIRGQRDEKNKRSVVGVLQLINKNGDDMFNNEDEDVLSTLLNIAGPMLQHSSFFNNSDKKKEEPGMESHPNKGRDKMPVIGRKVGSMGASSSSSSQKKKKWTPRKMSAIGENLTKYNASGSH